jgi:hypothetical protein
VADSYQQGVPIRINDTFSISGTETNPTAVVYTIVGPDDVTTTYTWPGAPEITNSGPGVFRLSLSPPDPPGFYEYDVDATGTVVASRRGSFFIIPNAVPDPDVTWPVSGPCSPWASSQSVWACCGQPMTTVDGDECPVDMTAYAYEASELLFGLTARVYNGTCTKTVRPCGSGLPCGVQVLSRGHLVGWEGSFWSSGCGCTSSDRILLSGYPIKSITEVKIDGVVVDPVTYRLDGNRWLTRTRDPAEPSEYLSWPTCQADDLPDTESGTFSVTYNYGADPPLSGIDAATELACELYKACNSGAGECKLPSGTTRVIRQGVVIERLAFSAWGLQDGIWRTGLPRVDAFLNNVNPDRLLRRPAIWSPTRHLQYAQKQGS